MAQDPGTQTANARRVKSVEQSIADTDEPGTKLRKDLNWWDLTVFGVSVVIAAKMNDSEIAGPVVFAAVDAVIVKIPAPMTTETPKTVRSHQFRSLRNFVSGSSVSAIDCSTDLIRHRSVISWGLRRFV